MRLALRPTGIARTPEGDVLETTLLELVRAVSEVTEDDREVVATVLQMLRSGRVRLSGSFRGCFPDAA
jgi:hypothetical protein